MQMLGLVEFPSWLVEQANIHKEQHRGDLEVTSKGEEKGRN